MKREKKNFFFLIINLKLFLLKIEKKAAYKAENKNKKEEIKAIKKLLIFWDALFSYTVCV